MAIRNGYSPVILGRPLNKIVNVGSPVWFHVFTAGVAPLSYQWQFNGSDISGATNSTLALASTALTDGGTYSVVVTNAYGSVRATNALLTVNIFPTVTISSPTNVDAFFVPTNIAVIATANDADGTVSAVEFFAGTNRLGIRTSSPFQLTWVNAPVGRHVLTAKATDNRGATASSIPLRILVTLPPTNSFVQRQLPVGYWPGDLVPVSLLAAPRTFIHGYSVEDRPPTGWVVGLINQGGAFDTNTGVVRFGPFGDSTPRTLTYEVMVPLNETGDKMFVGTGSADGWGSFIVGDRTLSAPPVHPADRNPADFFITLGEVTNYLAAWQLGSDQNPVPIGFLTRAAMLWQAGQAYRFDPKIPNPPLWWLSLLASNALPGGGTAASQMPSAIQRSIPFTASVAVTPAGDVRAYAVEDHLPSGWAVTNISDGGILDARNGKIKWGPFFDASARTLSCQFIPSDQVAGAIVLSGVASFDGIDVPITGQRWTLALYDPTLPVGGHGIIRSKSGECRAMFMGEAGHRYVVAVSEDLVNWIPLVTVPAGANGAVQCVDLKARDAPWRFYRIFPE